MYESKNQELSMENEELQEKEQDNWAKIDMIEEENLYLKAIVNSQNPNKSKTTCINASTLTDNVN